MIKIPQDHLYFEEIGKDIWIMDNHKWALYCWELFRQKHKTIGSTLVHLDYHWDACDDCYNENEELYNNCVNKLKNADLKQLKADILNNEIICDSFISPGIFRDYIKKVHFHCFQTNTKIGLSGNILKYFNTEQYIHSNIDDLVRLVGMDNIILDLDLDIFNYNCNNLYNGKLWDENKINEYLYKISPLIKQSSIITIAASYGHSGTIEDTKYLVELVIPQIIKYNNY